MSPCQAEGSNGGVLVSAQQCEGVEEALQTKLGKTSTRRTMTKYQWKGKMQT